MQERSLRLGILGAARIALGGVIPAATRTDAAVAVATRGGKKAQEVREVAPQAQLFEDYASLLESADVDAIYIPLPNSMHVEWSLKALEAGEHVLCEKPLSQDAEEARKVVVAAGNRSLTLMEGFNRTEFGHRIDDPEDVRIVGSLEGGSLGDVGCYCVSWVQLSFRSEPRRASAFARFAKDGADEELAGVLEFDGGLGFVSCSAYSQRRERLEVVVTDGRIVLDAPFRPDKAGSVTEIVRGSETATEHFGERVPYRLELEEFAQAIREGQAPLVGPDEILDNAAL